MSENPYEPMSKEQKDAIVQGNGLTYTHEQMRQVQHAIAAGKNPLVALENVPRWEDMAGVDRIINRRVLELDPLPTPAQVLAELPLTRQMQDIVAYSRDEVRACLYGLRRPSAGDRGPVLGARPEGRARLCAPSAHAQG